MELLGQAWQYAADHSDKFWKAGGQHLQLSFTAILIAAAIGIPLGVFTSRRTGITRLILNIAGLIRVIPSIAVLLVLLPLVGVGFLPSLIALTVLALPPILINTDAGMRGVDRATLEAARGMGMSTWDSLWRVEIPLALPVIIGGIRTATVEVIASATLAAFIGGGGFGDFIQEGLAGFQYELLVGAVPVALLAALTEISLAALQRFVSPRRTNRPSPA